MSKDDYPPVVQGVDMSDTPRTDAKESETDSGGMERHAYYGWKFARTLEREAHKQHEEIERLKRDAERYRYMRSSATFQDRNGPGLYWYLPRWDRGIPIGERLDKAIDDALKAKP